MYPIPLTYLKATTCQGNINIDIVLVIAISRYCPMGTANYNGEIQTPQTETAACFMNKSLYYCITYFTLFSLVSLLFIVITIIISFVLCFHGDFLKLILATYNDVRLVGLPLCTCTWLLCIKFVLKKNVTVAFCQHLI